MGRTKNSEAGNLVLKRGVGALGTRTGGKANPAAKTRNGFEGLSEAPWRRGNSSRLRTPSIFKQPVTLVHTTSRETQKISPEMDKRMTALARVRDRPQARQLFWAKSLEGLRAMIPLNLAERMVGASADEPQHIEQCLSLAPKLEPTVGALSEEAATATLCTGIQFPAGDAPIMGQQTIKKMIDSNPTTSIDFSQPLVQIPVIAEADVNAQERRVMDARKRLQELRRSFMMIQ